MMTVVRRSRRGQQPTRRPRRSPADGTRACISNAMSCPVPLVLSLCRVSRAALCCFAIPALLALRRAARRCRSHRPRSRRRSAAFVTATPKIFARRATLSHVRLTSSSDALRVAPARIAIAAAGAGAVVDRLAVCSTVRCRSPASRSSLPSRWRFQVPQPAPGLPPSTPLAGKVPPSPQTVDRHVAGQGPVGSLDGRRAVPLAEAHAVLGDAAFLDQDRIGRLVDLDRIR